MYSGEHVAMRFEESPVRTLVMVSIFLHKSILCILFRFFKSIIFLKSNSELQPMTLANCVRKFRLCTMILNWSINISQNFLGHYKVVKEREMIS